MAKAVTTTPKAVVPTTDDTEAPRISRNLAICMDRSEPLPKFVRDEAVAALAKLDEVCKPAGYDLAYDWLTPMAVGCTISLTEEDFENKAAVICPLLAELPAKLLTPATMRDALASHSYFPGAGVLHAWLMSMPPPDCREQSACLAAGTCMRKCSAGFRPAVSGPRAAVRTWLRDQAKLRRVVAIPEREPEPELTLEQREAIAAKFREKMGFQPREVAAVRRRSPLPVAGLNPKPPSAEHLSRMRAMDPLIQAAIAQQRQLAAEREARQAEQQRQANPPPPARQTGYVGLFSSVGA